MLDTLRIKTLEPEQIHYDMQTAAQALTGNLILVTNNTAEFERIPGLKLGHL